MKPKHFKLAKKLATKSTHTKHHVGCVIAYNNKVWSMGFNKMKTHTKSNHAFKMIHAEVDAFIGRNRRIFAGCDAYVYRQTKNGNPAMAKPCEACEKVLRAEGIETVYYTTDGGYAALSLKEQQ